MFAYATFIQELRSLAEQGRGLADQPQGVDAESFRRWRHQVCDLISRIGEQGHRVNCRIVDRGFGARGWYSNQSEKAIAFKRDMADTIIEIELLVTRFDQYGDPTSGEAHLKKRGGSKADGPAIEKALQPTEKVTLVWLQQHVPISMWLKVLGTLVSIVFSAFLLGVTVGQSDWYQKIVSILSTPANSDKYATSVQPHKTNQ